VYDTQLTSIPSAINFLTRSVLPKPQASQNSSCFVAARPITTTQTPAHTLLLYTIIIIIIERKDLGGVMSKDCKDTLQTLKTVTKRECDAK